MNAYHALADSYDRLTQDIPYGDILEFYQKIWNVHGKAPHFLVDLACGTGSLSVLLAQQGYRVLGVDAAEEMLTVAADKASGMENPPYFVCQRMEKLRLPMQADCVVSCLDSINYLVEPALCQKAFQRVYDALTPGGCFLFDVNTPEKLRAMDGQVFLDEDEDVYCVWRGSFDEASNICTYGMDLFQREGKHWRRSGEEHQEYAYGLQELQAYLLSAGFEKIEIYGNLSLRAPQDGEQRVFFYGERKERS